MTGDPTAPWNQRPDRAGYRTSPRIVLVHTVTFKQARSLVPAAIPLLAAFGIGGGTTMVVLLVLGVTVLSLVFAAISWWRFSYLDGPASVVVTRGLLSRSVRTVPNDRIRGVEVETPLLHRLFGLVRVRIDAAAGAIAGTDEELLIDGVPRAEGDRLRAAVLTSRSTPPPAEDDAAAPEPVEEELARFDSRWLLYAPLVGSYLAVPLAGLGALSRFADEVGSGLRIEVDGAEVADAGMVALVVAAGLLLLAVAAVIGAAVVNWRFRLDRRGGSLVAVRGLFTRRHTELEVDRIRGCTVSEGAGMRLVRAARVSALVTGLGDAAKRGQLLPLGPRSEAWRLTRRVVDVPGPLIAHPPAARRRSIVGAIVFGLLVSVAGAVIGALFGWWWVLAAGVALTLLGIPIGLGSYAALGHATGPTSFTVRSGWLVREQAVLQRRAVVGWQVTQSVLQRRADLATVTACVGAGTGGYSAVDLAAGEVAAFTAAASEDWARTLSPTAP